MIRDEAEMEYLRIAQDFDMYGVNYFPITVSEQAKEMTEITGILTIINFLKFTEQEKYRALVRCYINGAQYL